MTDIVITLRDLDDARHTLGACLNYFIALDLADQQRRLANSGNSVLTQEIERVKSRFDSYMGDYLLQMHESELEAEEDSEEEPEIPVEEGLAVQPLGHFEVPKQEGRRVSREELLARFNELGEQAEEVEAENGEEEA